MAQCAVLGSRCSGGSGLSGANFGWNCAERSLINRENTGNSPVSGTVVEIPREFSTRGQAVGMKFPTRTNREFFLPQEGICSAYEGIPMGISQDCLARSRPRASTCHVRNASHLCRPRHLSVTAKNRQIRTLGGDGFLLGDEETARSRCQCFCTFTIWDHGSARSFAARHEGK